MKQRLISLHFELGKLGFAIYSLTVLRSHLHAQMESQQNNHSVFQDVLDLDEHYHCCAVCLIFLLH